MNRTRAEANRQVGPVAAPTQIACLYAFGCLSESMFVCERHGVDVRVSVRVCVW